MSHWRVLGIRYDASAPEANIANVTAAYRRAAQHWHPDKCQAPDAAERFKAAHRAYEVLTALLTSGRALVLDADDVDTATIPYARSVLTRQGWVCSTRPAPNSSATEVARQQELMSARASTEQLVGAAPALDWSQR